MVLQIGAGFRDYKSEQVGSQIGATLGISSRCKEISNWGNYYKSGQEGFQIGIWITNQCRTTMGDGAIEWTLSMLDKAAWKTIHKDEDGDN